MQIINTTHVHSSARGEGGGVGASVFEAGAPIKFSYLPVYRDLANRA